MCYIDRDAQGCRKHAAFASHRVQGLTFKAFAIETYGYVDAEAMSFLRAVSQAAASTGHVTYGALLASAQREISVALCKGCLLYTSDAADE